MSAPVQDFCKRGHKMALSRKFHPNGDSYCYECKKIRTDRERKANPEKKREYYRTSKRKQTYGITNDRYREIMDQAGHKCMICGRGATSKSLHIDHCHSARVVRGILCHGCNTALGLFREDISVLKSAIEYLANPPLSEKMKD